jgi:hypothetical protein
LHSRLVIDILWKGRRWLLLSAPGHLWVGWAAVERAREKRTIPNNWRRHALSLAAGSAKFPQAVANVKDYACLLFPQRLLLRGPENQHTYTHLLSFLPESERASLLKEWGGTKAKVW